MKKLRLDLDRLRVQSFDTGGMAVADVREDGRSDMVGGCSGQDCPTDGTVQAYATGRNPEYCRGDDDCSHTGGAGCGPAARGTDGYTCTGHPNTC